MPSNTKSPYPSFPVSSACQPRRRSSMSARTRTTTPTRGCCRLPQRRDFRTVATWAPRTRRPPRRRRLPARPEAQPGRRRLAAPRRHLGREPGRRLRSLARCRRAAGLRPTSCPPRDEAGRTVWVTRARPKVDRIACPWLIRRFVDPEAVFLFVAPVRGAAPSPSASTRRPSTSTACSGAIAASAAPSTPCSRSSGWTPRPLDRLAAIVRAADTAQARPRAAGGRLPRGLARPVAHVPRRPRAARRRHAALRRLLSLVPRCDRGNPQLAVHREAGVRRAMTSIPPAADDRHAELPPVPSLAEAPRSGPGSAC